MYVEEICLSTADAYSDLHQPAEPAEVTAGLEQVNRMRRCQSQFTLFNNHCLAVKTRGFLQHPRDYSIDIGILDPHPKRMRKIAWHYLLIFFVLGAAAWFLAFISVTANGTLLSVILSASAALSLVLGIYRSHDRLVFYSRYGRVPLVVLFNRLPDRVAFDAFTDALAKHIKDARAHYPCQNETLSEELKAHRRLREEGVISSRRYDIVKQRILGQHSCCEHSTGQKTRSIGHAADYDRRLG
jgi:hypothetical protein